MPRHRPLGTRRSARPVPPGAVSPRLGKRRIDPSRPARALRHADCYATCVTPRPFERAGPVRPALHGTMRPVRPRPMPRHLLFLTAARTVRYRPAYAAMGLIAPPWNADRGFDGWLYAGDASPGPRPVHGVVPGQEISHAVTDSGPCGSATASRSSATSGPRSCTPPPG